MFSFQVLTFLQPIGDQAARKTHRLDAQGRLKTDSYGNAARFTHHIATFGDIESLHTALVQQSAFNRFVIRGSVRPGAGRVIYKRKIKPPADIVDTASTVIPVDLDKIPCPDWLDTTDILAVGDWLRAQLPAELADTSCVVQLSASAGLAPYRPELAGTVSARLWFINHEPIAEKPLRRWFDAANKAGRTIQMDAAMATANQAIYTAVPRFEGLPDPVKTRYALLLGERDECSLSLVEPPKAPEKRILTVSSPDARCLSIPVAMIRKAVANGEPRHPAILKAGYLAGGFVASGAITRDEALDALMPLVLESGSEGADRALIEAIDSGMLSPVAPDSPDSESASSEPKELPELPESHRPPVYPKISARGAAQKTQRLAEDIYAHPRTADGAARIVVIRSATGIGKTKVVMDVARNAPVKTLWLTPAHDLADEAEQRFDELDKTARAIETGNLIQFMPYTATAMRGRGAKAHESQASSPLFMCEKPKALRAVKNKNLALYTKSLLCKTKDTAGVEVKCEFLQQGTCRYYKQMRDPAKVRVLAHNYLTTPTAELVSGHINEVNYLTGQCPVIVIDESPIASLKRDCRWVDDDKKAAGALSAWMKDADLMRVAGAVLHGAVIPEAERIELLGGITAALEAMPDSPPATRPSDCDEAIAAALNDFQPVHDPALKGMFLAAQRWLSGHTNTLWKGTQDGKPALFSQWYARVTVDSPILILDASADEAIYRALFGNKVEFHGFDTPMAPGVTVTQVSDNTFYQRKLDATKALKKGAMDADQARRAYGLQARLAAFLLLAGAEQGQAGIVSYKGALDGMDADSGRIPGILDLIKAPALHYGSLVGMDTLKALPLLIVAGRIEPDELAMEGDARALWPDADLNLSGAYQQYRTHYTMRDGTAVPAVVRQHPDWRVAACLRQAREEGLIQAIGRGRYIHSTGQRELIVACNVPVPGLIVDRLVTMDEILPERRLALSLLAGKGTAPLSAGWLTENLPAVFPKEQAAKDFAASFKVEFSGNRYIYPGNSTLKTGEGGNSDESFKGSFPGNRYLYPGKQGLKLVEYRLEGQRGGKAKRAVTKCADLQSAALALGTLMAAPVASIRFEDDAPAAQPAATGNLAALSGGYFDADAYEPMNEAEFEALQDWCWPEEAGAG